MRYSRAFKARKYVLKSWFFGWLFLVHIARKLFYWMKKLHQEAVTDKGQCGHCHSLDIEFDSHNSLEDGIEYFFTCNKCGKKGREIYSLEYLRTIMEKVKQEEKDGKKRTARRAVVNPEPAN